MLRVYLRGYTAWFPFTFMRIALSENVYQNKDTVSSRLHTLNSKTDLVCWEIQAFDMLIF